MDNLKFLRKWQHRLRLDDYDIKLETVAKFKSATQVGETKKLSIYWQQAVVVIKRGMSVHNTQRTIVHELLHIRFAACSLTFKGGTDDDLNMEQAIEMTAKALLNVKRVR